MRWGSSFVGACVGKQRSTPPLPATLDGVTGHLAAYVRGGAVATAWDATRGGKCVTSPADRGDPGERSARAKACAAVLATCPHRV